MITIRKLKVIVNKTEIEITIKLKGIITDVEIDKMISNILSTKKWVLV